MCAQSLGSIAYYWLCCMPAYGSRKISKVMVAYSELGTRPLPCCDMGCLQRNITGAES